MFAKTKSADFSGNPLTWQTFKIPSTQLCITIHLQKFNYLRAQLEGDAARVIAGLSLTSPNYDNAITLLTKWFEKPQNIINAYMQALLDVTDPVNSLSSLQLFYDTIGVIFKD